MEHCAPASLLLNFSFSQTNFSNRPKIAKLVMKKPSSLRKNALLLKLMTNKQISSLT